MLRIPATTAYASVGLLLGFRVAWKILVLGDRPSPLVAVLEPGAFSGVRPSGLARLNLLVSWVEVFFVNL